MSETGNPAAAEAPGAALTAARQAQNLSVADVARQLKLSVSQIEALEAGAFEKLPGPIFVRGFIRNYARLLKLDPKKMLSSVEPRLPAQPPSEGVPPSKDIPFPPARTRPWPWYAAAMLLLIGGLVAYEFYWNESEFTVVKPVTAPSPVTVVAEPAPGGPAAPAVADVAAAAAAAQDAKAVAKTAQTAAQSMPAAVSDEDRLPKPGERPLQFVFQEESWVEIQDRSGKIIFSQLNQAGSKRRVYGTPPLSVVVGNAHGVRLTYNGEPVDLSRHTKVDVARLTLE